MKKENFTTQRKKYWFNHVNNFYQSELSVTEYCKKHKINYSTFLSYKGKLPKPSETLSTNSFKIKLNNELELTFDQLPDPNWLGKIIKSFGETYAQDS